ADPGDPEVPAGDSAGQFAGGPASGPWPGGAPDQRRLFPERATEDRDQGRRGASTGALAAQVCLSLYPGPLLCPQLCLRYLAGVRDETGVDPGVFLAVLFGRVR